MLHFVKNISKPTLSAPTEPASKAGKTALNMAQKGILDAKIKIFVDIEEILKDDQKSPPRS